MAPATQQGRQQRTTYRIEIRPKNFQVFEKCSVFASRPGRPKKAFKNALRDPPRTPPGGGKSTQNGPKIRKEGLKTVPRAVHAIFQVPLFRPERPPQADLAPKTPQRAPEAHLGPPGGRNLTPGGRNLTPGASFFRPPGVDFSTPCEPLSHAAGP